ncbi:transcriptional regulator [Rahnella variigena]|nr:transcriptional regulator [Rahnella aquatilis]RJT55144.1 transcriptional regulator [Rahnella variigena]RYJ19396.1 transcriptional regulator [Rahnella variigena]
MKKNCNNNATSLKADKKAPFGVLFCGLHQSLHHSVIDFTRQV